MQIKTSNGKSYNISAIAPMLRSKRLLIEFEDLISFETVARDFDGVDRITRHPLENDEIYECYDGYTKLISISISDNNRMRVTLGIGK